MDKFNGKLKKFFIGKETKVLLWLTFVISLLGTIVLSALEFYNISNIFLTVLLNVFTICCSIAGTNLLLSASIQVKTQNQMYKDFVIDELISNKDFLETLQKNQRDAIYNAIIKIDYPQNDNLYYTFARSFLGALYDDMSDYYFENLEVDIDCSVSNRYIQKEINQTWRIRSFDKERILYHLQLVRVCCHKCDEFKQVELNEVKINGIIIDLEQKSILETTRNDDPLGELKGYDIIYERHLKQEVPITSDKSTTIVVKYISRVSINDMSYSYRLKAPCKNFHFDFKIHDECDPNKKFKIISRIYGLQYKSKDVENSYSPDGQRVIYNFDRWGAKDDGVSLSFCEEEDL